ncbi:MAG TPA: glycosyltransferase [Polyangiaceae bacterium]|nr:glycosyltransferase [Polyangiaceae bacterium]
MRVLDLAEFYSERGGGVRSYLDKMLRCAGPLGHEVIVVAPGPRDEETRVAEGGRIVRYAAPRMPYDPSYHAPLDVFRMRALVRELAPDVLQLSSPFVPSWVGATLGVPLRSYVYHSDPIGCYVTPLAKNAAGRLLERAAWAYMKAVCGSADVTIVAGEWLERELSQRGFENVHTVPFGIDHEPFGPERRDDTLRAEILGDLANDPEARLVLIAGRLAADKRQLRLIEALEIVAKRRPIGLVLLGDGPERARLEAAGRRLPRFRALLFTRDRNEYARLLASVDALAHGSTCETFGFLLAECLASGTPLVVPDAGGAADLTEPGWSERYPPYADPETIALALERLLGRPVGDLRRCARERAASLPTTESHFRALFDLYAARLAERSRV